MSFLTRLLLVTLLSGYCISQNQKDFILFTLKSIDAKQDSLLQKIDVLEDTLLAQPEPLEDKLLAKHNQLENLKLSVSRCSTKHQISTFLYLLVTDECERNTNNCSIYATCKDSPIYFECSCMAGYSGDGVICEDVDECKDDSNVCGDVEVCINLSGNYTCICKDGYVKQGDICQDVDECKDDSSVCGDKEVCINLPGNYTCICQDGYAQQEDICQDVDECKDDSNVCGDVEVCINLSGNFTCICQDGYVEQGDICQDIDECSVENKCSIHASCTNIGGGYTCQCSPGLEGDGNTCRPNGFVCTSPSLELEPFGCITYVQEMMTWSNTQAKCKANGGSLLHGFTTKQQLTTIVQHIHQHFYIGVGIVYFPWVGVKGELFVNSPSDDGSPGTSSSPDPQLWSGIRGFIYPNGTLGDDTQCGYITPYLDHSDVLMDGSCLLSNFQASLCQILY